MTRDEDDVIALGRAVRARRERVGLRQKQIEESGGPSGRTLRLIEAGDARNLTDATLARIDTALFWDAGTARKVLDGEVAPDHAVELRQVALVMHNISVDSQDVADAVAEEFGHQVAVGDTMSFVSAADAQRARNAVKRAQLNAGPRDDAVSASEPPSREDDDEGVEDGQDIPLDVTAGTREPAQQVVRSAARPSQAAVGTPTVGQRNPHGRRSGFRASQPLAEALAELQQITDPTAAEERAMGLVWDALSAVMEEKRSLRTRTDRDGGRDRHVVPTDTGWVVSHYRRDRRSAKAATQAEAIRRASDILAAEDGGTLTVRGTDSKMTSSARVEGDGTRTVSKGDE